MKHYLQFKDFRGEEYAYLFERTRLLIHLVDASADTVVADLAVVEGELLAYGHGLPERPRLVVLNKIEVLDDAQQHELAAQVQAHTGAPPLLISAAAAQGLDALLARVWQALEEQRRTDEASPAPTEITPLTRQSW